MRAQVAARGDGGRVLLFSGGALGLNHHQNVALVQSQVSNHVVFCKYLALYYCSCPSCGCAVRTKPTLTRGSGATETTPTISATRSFPSWQRWPQAFLQCAVSTVRCHGTSHPPTQAPYSLLWAYWRLTFSKTSHAEWLWSQASYTEAT